MSKLTDSLLKLLGGFVFFVAVVVLGSITNGFVLKSLWAWFIVPVFTLPVLSIVQAIGVAYVVRVLVQSKKYGAEKTEKPWQGLTVNIFVLPLIFLLFGWVLHLFL